MKSVLSLSNPFSAKIASLGLGGGMEDVLLMWVELGKSGGNGLTSPDVVSLHDSIQALDLEEVPPLEGVFRSCFLRALTSFDPLGPMPEAPGVPARFVSVPSNLLDWLHGKGWRDPEFVALATLLKPEVVRQWEVDAEQHHLSVALPPAGGDRPTPGRL